MSADGGASTRPFRLIVTADDFGFGPAVSAGIVRAHLRGPVTATSVMSVTGDALTASLPLLEQAPKLELGLHLVLTGGFKPLTGLRGSGLVGRDGRFGGNGRLWLAAWAGRIDVGAAFDEICAQAAAFTRAIGRAPAYVDAHHHVHQLPGVRDALARAIDAGALPPTTRTTIEAPGVGVVRGSCARRLAARRLGRAARGYFSSRDIWSNDSYFGMLGAADLRRNFPWDRQLAALRQRGIVEWVVHPGEMDPTLIGRDSYVHQRVTELDALTDPARAAHWEHLRPFVTTKSALRPR